jgi:osmotically-inducible protein OsmY
MAKKVIVIAVAALALSASAWAAAPSNLQLFRQVQKQVLQYPHFTIFDTVNAQVDNGVVVLTGRVTLPYKRSDLEKRVAKVAGISRVDDRIQVLPASRFDDQLRLGIARAIYRNPAFQMYGSMVNPPIHVIVEHGHVTLDGVVQSEMDKMLARSIAGSFPAFSVTNQLKTEAEVKTEMEKL